MAGRTSTMLQRKAISAVLARGMAAKRMSGPRLAELAGVAPRNVKAYMQCARKINDSDLLKIAAVLGLNPDELRYTSYTEDGAPIANQGVPAASATQDAAPRPDRIDRMLGLLERLEEDVRSAIAVADKSADAAKAATDAVKQMSADTHVLITRSDSSRSPLSHVPAGGAQRQQGGAIGGEEAATAERARAAF